MKIAVVDDLMEDRRLLAEKIEAYMHRHKLFYVIEEFNSAEDFLAAFQPADYDIIFMDIYMKRINGFDAAVKLRETDMDCKLIFLTMSEDYLRQGYTVNACHYLVKPIKEEEFEQALEHCRIRPQFDVPVLQVISGGIKVSLDTGKILYICMEKRVVMIHTVKQVVPVIGTFNKVTEPLLSDRRFLLIIQGILVNMDKITGQEESMFRLVNGDQVQINVRNKKSVLQAYRKYIFESIGEVY